MILNRDDCCNDNRRNDREISNQQMRQPIGSPPNFTPTLPESERGKQREMFGGSPGFGPDQRNRGGPGDRDFDRGRRPRNLRSCLNRFTFIWLFNGDSFWFYPIMISGQQVVGFRWQRGAWVFDRINIRRIFFHQCY